MRIYLVVSLAVLSAGLSESLECKPGISEANCAQLHEQYANMYQDYERAQGRQHVNPLASGLLHMELARVATLIGKVIPGTTPEQMQRYAAQFGAADLEAELRKETHPGEHGETTGNQRAYDVTPPDERTPESENTLEGDHERMDDTQNTNPYSTLQDDSYAADSEIKDQNSARAGDRACASWVPKERCAELLRQYVILKELYGNETTKDMLSMDAYHELLQRLTEAGVTVQEVHTGTESAELKCDSSVTKEECDILLKKYKVMEEMYSDEDLMEMLNPDAYTELHREMENAGIHIHGNTKETAGYSTMKCDSSVTKEECDILLKKYKVMKEMYSDDDLMEMLNPDAYTKLHREMEKAGLHVQGNSTQTPGYSSMKCDSSVSKKECEILLKKYKVMKEMYSDADLMEMLNPDAYTELHREMEKAGIHVEGKTKEASGYSNLKCDSTVTKEDCDTLLKKYKVMKEMYSDEDLMEMLNPDAYTELHREMEAAGIQVKGSTKETPDYSKMKCDSTVPKEECDILLKKYKVMKEMYNDEDLMEMLNPDAYTELHREMEGAGIHIQGKTKECDSSVTKEQCDILLKKYKVMKEMYSDEDLMEMLNPDAYTELHREMEEAGLHVQGISGKTPGYSNMKCNTTVTKKECDTLLKKYKAMKEMYSDADLMEMLNSDAYTELHRQMEKAGIHVQGKIKKDPLEDSNDAVCS